MFVLWHCPLSHKASNTSPGLLLCVNEMWWLHTTSFVLLLLIYSHIPNEVDMDWRKLHDIFLCQIMQSDWPTTPPKKGWGSTLPIRGKSFGSPPQTLALEQESSHYLLLQWWESNQQGHCNWAFSAKNPTNPWFWTGEVIYWRHKYDPIHHPLKHSNHTLIHLHQMVQCME